MEAEGAELNQFLYRVNVWLMRVYQQNNYSFYNNEKESLPILCYKGIFLMVIFQA